MLVSKEERLRGLTQLWRAAKTKEQDGNKDRLIIEKLIQELCDLPEKGTTSLDTGLKIVTGVSASCNSGEIDKLYNQWTTGMIPNAVFPFRAKWEPTLSELAVISSNDPQCYHRFYADVVTIKPKKPSFELNFKKFQDYMSQYSTEGGENNYDL